MSANRTRRCCAPTPGRASSSSAAMRHSSPRQCVEVRCDCSPEGRARTLLRHGIFYIATRSSKAHASLLQRRHLAERERQDAPEDVRVNNLNLLAVVNQLLWVSIRHAQSVAVIPSHAPPICRIRTSFASSTRSWRMRDRMSRGDTSRTPCNACSTAAGLGALDRPGSETLASG